MLLYRHTGAWVEFIVTYASVTSQQLNISGGVWSNHSLQLTMQRPPPPFTNSFHIPTADQIQLPAANHSVAIATDQPTPCL